MDRAAIKNNLLVALDGHPELLRTYAGALASEDMGRIWEAQAEYVTLIKGVFEAYEAGALPDRAYRDGLITYIAALLTEVSPYIREVR